MTQPPFNIEQILFPTDFSKPSEAAASHVAGLAKAVNARATILNVVPWLSGWHGASAPHVIIGDDVLRKLELSQKESEASALKALEALERQYFQDIQCDLSIETGGVAESIVEHAQKIQADLIMMPTRGFGPSRPFLIGSVTAKVLHDARCAIWTTPHPRELEVFRPYRHIVCAMDYRASSRDLLTRASQLARLFDTRLSLVSAIPCPASGSVPCTGRHSVRLLKSETESVLRQLLQELSIDAPIHVLEGTVGEVIRTAVAMEDGDLVVIGRGDFEEPSGHLLTHAYETIWNSPSPVLSL